MGQVTSHHLSDLHIPDQIPPNKNHVTTTEPPQPQPPIQLPTKNRAPSPPRPPRYAVAQNRVLPFGVPKTSLRPVSAEFRHRFPDYNRIYGDQSDENEDIDDDTNSENIDSSTSAANNLNHDVVENHGFADAKNQPVPNNGYKKLHSSYGNLQQLKENRKHENDLLRSGNGYRPKSLVAFENETESMKPGKACLVDNGQIINLPQKSSFEMDYSFAVTYAQLAKHRRQQNLQKIREKEESWVENHPIQVDDRSSDRSNDRSDLRLDEHEHNLHEKYRDQNQHTDDKLVENRSHKHGEDRLNIDRKDYHKVDRKKINNDNENESGIQPHGDISDQHDINTHTMQHSNITGHSNPTDRNTNGVNINENITDINETKVKYRAPPPPRKSGIEPPIDYDMSDDSDGSDIRVSIPESPRHENNCDYSRNSSALMSPRKGSDDSFAMVDLNGSVSNEHLSPTSTVDKTRRLNSLLQHDIIHAAVVRQVKLKRVNPKLPAQKSSDEITQTELSKICEEREKRQKVTPTKLELFAEKTKERNLDVHSELTHGGAKKKDIFGTSISPITNSNKSSDVESRVQSSDVSFEKVENPKDDESVKDYDIISNDEVEISESETKKERTILSLVNVNKSTYVKSGNIKSANSTDFKSANVRKSTELKKANVKQTKDDSFESSYENNHAEVGIKPSNLSTDWTPEHDLEESEDDEKLVLTSTKSKAEGFKKTIVPSQGMGNTLNIKVANDAENTGNFRSLLKFNKLNCNIKRENKTDVDKSDVDTAKSESEKSNNKSKSSDNKSKSSDGDKKVESFEIDFRSSKKKKSVKDKAEKQDSVNVKSNKKSSIKLAKRASNRKSKADVKNVPITKASHHASISTLSSEDRSYTGHSSSSFCLESDEIRDDSLDGKVESDNLENIDDKTANKRVKKMRKLGYISTAKKKEKKRLQLYLQEQIDQQERRIEAECKKQREIEKQIRTLDSGEDSSGEDDELDEVVYKTKKSKSPPRSKSPTRDKSPPVSVQYVTQLPYTMPVLSQMNSLSLNPASNAQIPQSYIPPYSGWYGNPTLQYPALQYSQIPQFQMPQVSQMSNIQPQQPISYDLLQYMRLMEQNQLANQINQNQPIPNWSDTEKQNGGLLNTQQHDFSNSTQKPHVPNPTQFDNLNGITVNGSNNINNSNSVMIDDALLCAMMHDYKHTKNGSVTGKTLTEKRSNPIYDSSDDEINYNTKQTNIPVTVDVNGAKLTNHNAAIYGPVGYRPINFSPKQKITTTQDHDQSDSPSPIR